MIVEQALTLAGPRAVLAARPRGCWHVYVGPLTPSGRFVPRAARTVCRARTRRLAVVEPPVSSLQPGRTGRLCARCSARLALQTTGRVEHTTGTDRGAYLRRYAGTPRSDIAFALEVAQTPAEVDAAAHLSLLLFGTVGCHEPFVERGRAWASLHRLVVNARVRVEGYPEERYAARMRDLAQSLTAAAERAEIGRRIRTEREERIARIGFLNATQNDGSRRARGRR